MKSKPNRPLQLRRNVGEETLPDAAHKHKGPSAPEPKEPSAPEHKGLGAPEPEQRPQAPARKPRRLKHLLCEGWADAEEFDDGVGAGVDS